MAKRERNKRSARKARQKKRAELEAIQQASGNGSAQSDSSSAKGAKKSEATSKQVQKQKANKKPGVGARIRNYFKLVRTEMHKVVWPSRTELRNWSLAVVVMLIVFGVCVWAVDTGFVAALVGFTSLRG